jgi:hypothetical protein
MIKLFFSITFASALLGSTAFAQTSTSSTTVAADGTTQTTTTETSGVVTEFTPGTVFILKTEAAEPVHYKFAKTVTYVTADGRVIKASKIRKDSKVHVHYIKDNDDMLVDRVTVDQD